MSANKLLQINKFLTKLWCVPVGLGVDYVVMDPPLRVEHRNSDTCHVHAEKLMALDSKDIHPMVPLPPSKECFFVADIFLDTLTSFILPNTLCVECNG